MELIQQLVGQLGVNEEQASGGAGLLLKLAKEKLAGDDFSKITSVLPETDQLINAAPEEESSGMMGAIGGLVSGLGGDSQLGDLASLIGGFDKLGLDANMIQKFVPIILAFFEGKGGPAVKNLLADLISGK